MTLKLRLTAALGQDGYERPVRILRRTLPPFMSTFPNEIVTCRLPDGRKRRVFAKYQAGQSHNSYGHRGDVRYETEVYRRLLRALPNFRPKCLGAHTDLKFPGISLFLESLSGRWRLSDWVGMRKPRHPRGWPRVLAGLGKSSARRRDRC